IQHAPFERFVIASPAGTHLCADSKDLVDGNAEPFFNTSVDECECKEKEPCRGNQRERNEGDQNRRLNFDPGFCCCRSAQTLTNVRRSTNPKINKTRNTNAEIVTSSTI